MSLRINSTETAEVQGLVLFHHLTRAKSDQHHRIKLSKLEDTSPHAQLVNQVGSFTAWTKCQPLKLKRSQHKQNASSNFTDEYSAGCFSSNLFWHKVKNAKLNLQQILDFK